MSDSDPALRTKPAAYEACLGVQNQCRRSSCCKQHKQEQENTLWQSR
jgi:hypothetical protein